MDKIETVQEFKNFLKENRKKILEKAVKIEDIPPDDDWILDSKWDEIYKKGIVS